MHDLRFACRQLLRNPGFSAVAILTLVLGIGATTAIFSVVHGVLLVPQPFEHPHTLMMVWETDRNSGTSREPASLPDYLDFRDRTSTFEALAGFTLDNVNVARDDDVAIQLTTGSVTHEFLPMLGVEPILGRTFAAAETQPGGGDAVLISERTWQRLYDRAPGVLGRHVRLDGVPRTIIGVVPDHASFGLQQVLGKSAYASGSAGGSVLEVGIWAPLQSSVTDRPRSNHGMFMLGRLAPGIDVAAAQAETAAIAAELERAYPENEGRGVHVEPLQVVVFSDVRPALLLLLAAVVIVLLVACANVANLLLARGAYRSREVALRASLGADARRLSRLFLMEGLVLALAGAAGGVLLAISGTDVLLALAPAGIPRLDAVGMDGRVLAVTLLISTAVGVAFGLVPVMQTRRVDLQTALRADGATGPAPGRGRLRSALVVTELALAVILVVGAGLMLNSFWQIRQVDPGFRAEGVLKAEFQLPPSRYPVNFSEWPDFREIHAFNAALLERATALAGVEHAALASSHPLDRGFTNSFSIVGGDLDSTDVGEISLRFVSPGYFDTVRLALLRGRGFEAGDATDAPLVAVINEAAAKRLFPDRDPLGRRIAYWGDERRIVGVVANEKFHGLTVAAPMAAYTPLTQTPPAGRSEVLLVRASGAPDPQAASVRAAILETDPELAVFGVEPLAETLGKSVAERRFTMLLLGLFAAVAMILAAIGIHGVLSYVVARRTSEIGLRMALGASRGRVLRTIMAQGARLAFFGLLLGIVGALFAGRLLESQLYGVAPTDPLTFAAVAAGVLGVALLSCWLPARRATTIDPMTALREE